MVTQKDPTKLPIHRWTQERLSAYVDDTLPAVEHRRIQTHLAECSRCANDLAGLQQTVDLLRQLPTQPAPRSFTLSGQYSRKQATGSSRSGPSWLFPYFRAAGALAAVLFLIVVAADLLQTLDAGGMTAMAPARRPSFLVGAPAPGKPSLPAGNATPAVTGEFESPAQAQSKDETSPAAAATAATPSAATTAAPAAATTAAPAAATATSSSATTTSAAEGSSTAASLAAGAAPPAPDAAPLAAGAPPPAPAASEAPAADQAVMATEEASERQMQSESATAGLPTPGTSPTAAATVGESAPSTLLQRKAGPVAPAPAAPRGQPGASATPTQGESALAAAPAEPPPPPSPAMLQAAAPAPESPTASPAVTATPTAPTSPTAARLAAVASAPAGPTAAPPVAGSAVPAPPSLRWLWRALEGGLLLAAIACLAGAILVKGRR